VHTLRDAIDLVARFDVGVCMELKRVLGRTRSPADDPRGIDRILLVTGE